MRYILLSVLAITICSCKVKHADTVNFNQPESVVRAYYKAFSELNFIKASEYCTGDFKPAIKTMGEIMSSAGDSALNTYKEEVQTTNKNIKTFICTDSGKDMKTCTVCCDTTGNALRWQVLVRKENGKWLVYAPKEIPTDDEAVPEEPVGN